MYYMQYIKNKRVKRISSKDMYNNLQEKDIWKKIVFDFIFNKIDFELKLLIFLLYH